MLLDRIHEQVAIISIGFFQNRDENLPFLAFEISVYQKHSSIVIMTHMNLPGIHLYSSWSCLLWIFIIISLVLDRDQVLKSSKILLY